MTENKTAAYMRFSAMLAEEYILLCKGFRCMGGKILQLMIVNIIFLSESFNFNIYITGG